MHSLTSGCINIMRCLCIFIEFIHYYLQKVLDKIKKQLYNIAVSSSAYGEKCSRGGIGIRARLRGVSERVRVQVPSTAPAKSLFCQLDKRDFFE